MQEHVEGIVNLVEKTALDGHGADVTATVSLTGVTMNRLVDDVLLFSCMAAFAVGIVLAAASLLG
jgi:hypothetical protein